MALIPLLAIVLAAHPIHSTMTELVVDERAHVVRATVRAFADDVRPATAEAYVIRGLTMAQKTGVVALTSCGIRRQGDVVFVCVEGTYSGDARALRLTDALLCERFRDQVNVVQVVRGDDRRSLLFTAGDPAKPLW